MKSKKCNKCSTVRNIESFKKDRTKKDGFHTVCKVCQSKMPDRTWGTIEYFISNTWGRLNQRTVNGSAPCLTNNSCLRYIKSGVRLEMTRPEFCQWCLKNKTTIINLYKNGDTPSINRIDPKKNYSIDNINIVSFKENSAMGVINSALRRSEPIVSIHIKSGKVKTFKSKKGACREGLEWRGVWTALRKPHGVHRGFMLFEESYFLKNKKKCIEMATSYVVPPNILSRYVNLGIV